MINSMQWKSGVVRAASGWRAGLAARSVVVGSAGLALTTGRAPANARHQHRSRHRLGCGCRQKN